MEPAFLHIVLYQLHITYIIIFLCITSGNLADIYIIKYDDFHHT